MKPVNIPEGYPQLMPYLILKNASSFIEFAREVFGAIEKSRHMRNEHIVMHAEISVGASIIMVADATETYPPRPAGMFVYVDDCDAIYQKALENGATSAMTPADQSYGRSGGFNDAFGNTWWITSI